MVVNAVLVLSLIHIFLLGVDMREKLPMSSLVTTRGNNFGLSLIILEAIQLRGQELSLIHISNENIQKLFTKQKISEDDENELTRGYGHAKDALKKVLEERQLNPQSFVDYLFENVIIFRSILPEDLDLNLYFERFNSR